MLVAEQWDSEVPFEVVVADDDLLLPYALDHSGAVEIGMLHLDSLALSVLKINRVEIMLPLVSQGELIGIFTLGARLDGQKYTCEHYGLLTTLASQVAPALRVALMVQEQQAQVRERERIEQELRTAQNIQQSFLPKELPVLPGWQLVPYYQPAREVGGDFYDFLPYPDGEIGIAIGDVTGKGVPAALVMATTHTILRSVVQRIATPAEVLAQVNALLCAEIPANMFVTCFYALLDPKSGRLSYANAGQDLPCRRHSAGVSELRATGMPLGMMPSTCYEEQEIMLRPGDSLLFFSDGLTEAHNAQYQMLDTSRIKALLAAYGGEDSLIDLVLSELKQFTGEGWEQEDDLTLIALQRTSASLIKNDA